MSEQEQKQISELLYWLQWTAQQNTGEEIEIIFPLNSQLGGIIINLN
ncbi:MAG: hypothetical protein ABL876_14810 [Chitinophagaceae bacterium]